MIIIAAIRLIICCLYNPYPMSIASPITFRLRLSSPRPSRTTNRSSASIPNSRPSSSNHSKKKFFQSFSFSRQNHRPGTIGWGDAKAKAEGNKISIMSSKKLIGLDIATQILFLIDVVLQFLVAYRDSHTCRMVYKSSPDAIR